MKNLINPVIIAFVAVTFIGCSGNRPSKKEATVESETVQVPDTGYTGIKKYYTNDRIFKEITFKNGIRHGEMKSYYPGGQVYQSFWYENGLREDSARWYYVEGPVFRSTPFRHDTIHGTQVQYYRNGRVKARLNYIKGLRTPGLEEYTRDGKLIKDYPEILYSLTDNYNSEGKVRINLSLNNQSEKVKFYRGEFVNGVFDTAKINVIRTVKGKAVLDLKKSGTPQKDYVGVIAEFITDFGNKYFTYKKIELPYKDLK